MVGRSVHKGVVLGAKLIVKKVAQERNVLITPKDQQ
jgi:hypothetical protein